jgi:hypothetical protein
MQQTFYFNTNVQEKRLYINNNLQDAEVMKHVIILTFFGLSFCFLLNTLKKSS